MKKLAYIVPLLVFVLVAAKPAHAKLHGCVDSPENPSAVLGLVLSAAGVGMVHIRGRFAKRRNLDQN